MKKPPHKQITPFLEAITLSLLSVKNHSDPESNSHNPVITTEALNLIIDNSQKITETAQGIIDSMAIQQIEKANDVKHT